MELAYYIGKKIVKAKKMDRKSYLVNRDSPQVEIEAIQAYVPGYLVIHADGYISWMPKRSFEIAFRRVSKGEEYILGMRNNCRRAG
jgi:hypothetical protein